MWLKHTTQSYEFLTGFRLCHKLVCTTRYFDTGVFTLLFYLLNQSVFLTKVVFKGVHGLSFCILSVKLLTEK